MARPLGKRQLEWLHLMVLGRFQVVGDPLTASLIRRGDAEAWQGAADFVAVTPQGLRSLADAIEGGRIEMPAPRLKKEA